MAQDLILQEAHERQLVYQKEKERLTAASLNKRSLGDYELCLGQPCFLELMMVNQEANYRSSLYPVEQECERCNLSWNLAEHVPDLL